MASASVEDLAALPGLGPKKAVDLHFKLKSLIKNA
jgi:recombinational DNA repair protein RecR